VSAGALPRLVIAPINCNGAAQVDDSRHTSTNSATMISAADVDRRQHQEAVVEVTRGN